MSATTVATVSSSRRSSNSVGSNTVGAPSPPLSSGARRMSATAAVAAPPAPVAASSARMTSLAQAAADTEQRRAVSARAASMASPRSTKSGATHTSRQTRSNSNASTRSSTMRASANQNNAASTPASTPSASTQKPRARTKQSSRDVVLTTTHSTSPHTTAAPPILQDTMLQLTIGLLGLKFQCHVQRNWPCEAMIATAIAKYHLAYPACELPDFNTIYHLERKAFVAASDLIGDTCADDDELDLGITDKPTSSAPSPALTPSEVSAGSSSDGGRRELFDFRILFHRLPLGFTLKQNNEHIVVANIYPHSTATHYERLEPGVRVVQIADTLLANLGLRQVHDLIKNATIPLAICFRGFQKPSLRTTLLLAAAIPTTAETAEAPIAASRIPVRRQSVPSPKPEDEDNDDGDRTNPQRSARGRTRSSSNASSARRVELVTTATNGNAQRAPSVNAAGGGNSRRTGRSRRGSQERNDERDVPRGTFHDNQRNNHHGETASTASTAQPFNRRGRSSSRSAAHHATGAPDTTNGVINEPVDVRQSDRDSNQNEDEAEEAQLVEQIEALKIALLKKHEEVKQINRQLELFHDKLATMRTAKTKTKSSKPNGAKTANGDANTNVRVPPPPHSAPASTTAASAPKPTTAKTAASLKLRLTPEVLEAMDSKAGVPPKSASYYQSSNVSSVSGYSNYSSRSNAAAAGGPRSARTARRADSVTSRSSATSERHRSSSQSRSPRAQCVKNINNRYSYIPQKYSSSCSSSAEAPTSSSLSSRGAVMSRAKATRDSFIVKSESPGVGYYDVKLPTSNVRGGEIGDSDRSLPWP